MILHVLNLQFKQLKRFPQLQKLIDQFVGKRLGNELEKEKDKSLEVILFYEKYIQYLIRQDICIWEEVHRRHRLNGKYIRVVNHYSFRNGRGSIQSVCNRERKNGKYYREQRLKDIWHYDYYDDHEYTFPYDDRIKFVMIDIYCSYMSLFDKKLNRYGKHMERKISHINGNKYIYDKYTIECNCKLCNHVFYY